MSALGMAGIIEPFCDDAVAERDVARSCLGAFVSGARCREILVDGPCERALVDNDVVCVIGGEAVRLEAAAFGMAGVAGADAYVADHYVVGVFDDDTAAYDADARGWRGLASDGDRRLGYHQARTVEVDDSSYLEDHYPAFLDGQCRSQRSRSIGV
ncbi:MAG: hypothetical protein ACYSUY_03355 [Planctomycetota bacterium]